MAHKTRRSMLCQSVGVCSLCGLQIPNYIASPKHPLFGTIDHVIPLSRGGKDNAANRQPAHNICNRMKGNQHPVTEIRILEMQGNARALLIKMGETVNLKKATRRAANARRVANNPLDRPVSPITIQVWEGEGGASL